jgi:dihydroxyacetone kinase-like protein
LTDLPPFKKRLDIGPLLRGHFKRNEIMNSTEPYFENILDELNQQKDILNQLDTDIGDGDHGTNLVRGFKAVVEALKQGDDTPLSAQLMLVAKKLMSTVGGSSGPLLGGAFMGMSITAKGFQEIGTAEVAQLIESGYAKIQALGKATVGEATMLDAIYPTISAMQNATSLTDGFKNAALAARAGADSTIPMRATKGRASYLGERSVGHEDPGARSAAIIFDSIYRTYLALSGQPETSAVTTQNKTAPPHDVQDTKAAPDTPAADQNAPKVPNAALHVNVLLVSHSYQLARSTAEFIGQMKPAEVVLDYVGGIEEGKSFGSNPEEIAQKVKALIAQNGREVLVIYDLGSSRLNVDLAVGSLAPEQQKLVVVAMCAFLEGSLIALVSNTTASAQALKETVESQVGITK